MGAPSISRRRIGKSSLTRFQSTVIALPALRSRPERLVALALELLSELDAATLDDPTVDEDVDVVGLDLVEQTLVVRDHEDAHRRSLCAHLADSTGDDTQSVDV